MALPTYSTGTVSVAASGTVVTGAGTIWSGLNVVAGDMLRIGSLLTLITDVTDPTHLVIPPWPGAAQAGAAYTIYQNASQRFSDVQIALNLQQWDQSFNARGYIVFVGPDETVPDPSLGNENQWAHKPDNGAWWIKTGGLWVASVGPVKGYGGTSTSSLTIGVGTKAFVTQSGLAYDGMRVRATSTADRTKWMEGIATYVGTALTLTVDAFNGGGTINSWVFGIAGQPGNMTGSNNGAEFTNIETVRKTIYAAPFDAMQFGNIIPNGACEVAQWAAPAGNSNVLLTSSVSAHIIDSVRMIYANANATIYGYRWYKGGNPPSGYEASCGLYATTGTGALASSDGGYISWMVEGYRTARLGWGVAGARDIVVGFLVRASINGQLTVTVASAAANRSFRRLVSYTGAGNWEYKTITVPGDAASSDGSWNKTNLTGFRVTFCGFAGSSAQAAADVWASDALSASPGQTNFLTSNTNYFMVTGVYAFPGTETGSIDRNSLLFRTFDFELLAMKRYWQSSYNYGVVPGTAWTINADQVKYSHPSSNGIITFPIPSMRTTPTIRTFDSSGALGKNSYFDTSWKNGGTFFNVFAKENMLSAHQTTTNSIATNFAYELDARL